MSDLANFEWVKARAACSLAGTFARLGLDVQKDVDDRNSLLPPGCNFRFKVVADSNNVMVLVEGTKQPGAITFHLSDAAIEVVTINQKTVMSATPTFNENGECRLKVNGLEHEAWYFRKLALEELFFHAY